MVTQCNPLQVTDLNQNHFHNLLLSVSIFFNTPNLPPTTAGSQGATDYQSEDEFFVEKILNETDVDGKVKNNLEKNKLLFIFNYYYLFIIIQQFYLFLKLNLLLYLI